MVYFIHHCGMKKSLKRQKFNKKQKFMLNVTVTFHFVEKVFFNFNIFNHPVDMNANFDKHISYVIKIYCQCNHIC